MSAATDLAERVEKMADLIHADVKVPFDELYPLLDEAAAMLREMDAELVSANAKLDWFANKATPALRLNPVEIRKEFEGERD